jgi:hypothetical protein
MRQELNMKNKLLNKMVIETGQDHQGNLNDYVQKVMQLADDLATAALDLKGQGYSVFLNTRKELLDLLNKEEELCDKCAGKMCRYTTAEQLVHAMSNLTSSCTSYTTTHADTAKLYGDQGSQI